MPGHAPSNTHGPHAPWPFTSVVVAVPKKTVRWGLTVPIGDPAALTAAAGRQLNEPGLCEFDHRLPQRDPRRGARAARRGDLGQLDDGRHLRPPVLARRSLDLHDDALRAVPGPRPSPDPVRVPAP
jgi:hypothetical protein